MALYVKAFSLVLKTVSKPMAKSLKSFVVSQPELKKTYISMAQKINVLYSYVVVGSAFIQRNRRLGRGKERKGIAITTRGRNKSSASSSIKPLSDDVALTNGGRVSFGDLSLFRRRRVGVLGSRKNPNEREREKKKIAAMERQQLTKLMELTKDSLEDVVEELEELKRWRETVSKKNYKDLLQ